MEPLTFATLVSLLAQFVSQRSESKKLEADEFMSWLSENRHDEIKDLLESNTTTTISIKALLAVNHEELILKLEALDKALAIYASSISEFSELAQCIHPSSILSKQALSILKQLEKSGGDGILLIKLKGYATLQILNASGNISVDEHRFVEDDLKILDEYNLLRHDFNSNGDDIYLITRSATELVSSLQE